MLYFQAFIIAVIEGLTEFIPVSSTGHMLLVSDLVHFNHTVRDNFIIFIQLGAISAVFGVYHRHYLKILQGLKEVKSWKTALVQPQFPSVAHFFLAIFPILLIGLIFYQLIKTYLFGVTPVLIGLAVGGFIMIIADIACKKFEVKEVEQISLKQAFWIGLAQAFALWPGVSRSGSTMVAGLILKVSHKPSADFSFMIAAPVMCLAVSYDMWKSWEGINTESLLLLLFGFIIAFIVAFLSIKVFLKLLPKFKLAPFGIYRILLVMAYLGYIYYWGF